MGRSLGRTLQASFGDSLHTVQDLTYEHFIPCLENCGAVWDVLEIAEEALLKSPSKATFRGFSDILKRSEQFVLVSRNCSFNKRHLRDAEVLARPYPWMTSSQLLRSEHVHRTLKAELEVHCSVATLGVSSINSLTARNSTLADVLNSNGSLPCLGIFTTRDIPLFRTDLVRTSMFCCH